MVNWRKFILWFAQEHVDFRVQEFDSLVKMFGLQVRRLTEHTRVKCFSTRILKTQD